MARDDIIRWAPEAGLAEWCESVQEYGYAFANPDRLERFAALVAAHEREQCAKVCEDVYEIDSWWQCAAAIRARGDT